MKKPYGSKIHCSNTGKNQSLREIVPFRMTESVIMQIYNYGIIVSLGISIQKPVCVLCAVEYIGIFKLCFWVVYSFEGSEVNKRRAFLFCPFQCILAFCCTSHTKSKRKFFYLNIVVFTVIKTRGLWMVFT